MNVRMRIPISDLDNGEFQSHVSHIAPVYLESFAHTNDSFLSPRFIFPRSDSHLTVVATAIIPSLSTQFDCTREIINCRLLSRSLSSCSSGGGGSDLKKLIKAPITCHLFVYKSQIKIPAQQSRYLCLLVHKRHADM